MRKERCPLFSDTSIISPVDKVRGFRNPNVVAADYHTAWTMQGEYLSLIFNTEGFKSPFAS